MTKLSRRTVIKRSAGVAAAALAMPAVLRAKDALSSSGSVNVFAWGDYVQQNIKDAFEKSTGITVNLSTYGSNDEAENKLRAAGGKGFDVIFPSVDNGPNYYGDNLAHGDRREQVHGRPRHPVDLPLLDRPGRDHRGKRYLIPFDWGTEAMTFNAKTYPDAKFGTLSYGDMLRRRHGGPGRLSARSRS